MFDDIYNVDWSNLKSAGGNARNFPEVFMGMISDSVEERRNSLLSLQCTLENQGTLYESAYYAIPYLLKILDFQLVDEKVITYDVIYEICSKYSNDQGAEIVIGNKAVPLQIACKSLVINARDTFYKDLFNDSYKIRFLAFELLLTFEEVFIEMKSELSKRMDYYRNGNDNVKFNELRILLLTIDNMLKFGS